MSGKFIISFDCESKWGMADSLSSIHHEMFHASELERVYSELITLLEKYNMPATFGFVGALTMTSDVFLDEWEELLKGSPDHRDWLENFFQDVDKNQLSGWFCPELLNIVRQSHIDHEICSHGFTHLAWSDASSDALSLETDGILKWYEQQNIHPTTFIFPRNLVGHQEYLKKISAKAYRDKPLHYFSQGFLNRILSTIKEFNLFPRSQQPKLFNDLAVIPGGFFLNWRRGLRRFIPIWFSVKRFENLLNHAIKTDGTINLWSHPHNFLTGHNQIQLFEKCLKVVSKKIELGEISVMTQSSYLQSNYKNFKSLPSITPKVSVVIPSYGGEEHLDEILEALHQQTHPPEEVIFIISKVKGYQVINQKLKNEKRLNCICKIVEPSYPGKGRNIGASIATSEWLAFLDIRTIPNTFWLKTMLEAGENLGKDFIGARMICSSQTRYQENLKALTFGNQSAKALPGSIVRRKIFNQYPGFLDHVRAGEDWEWLSRIMKSTKHTWIDQVVISYKGLPLNIFDTLKKWFRYSIENSKVNILLKEKFFYVSILFFLFAIFLYRWNHLISGGVWDVSNPLFLPNVNKIFWSSAIGTYIIFRGLVSPVIKKEKILSLLPFRWFLIGILGMSVDIAKAPGRIIGFFAYLRMKH
jgi:glycosyltransferase involved in cell wall biosynthesis